MPTVVEKSDLSMFETERQAHQNACAEKIARLNEAKQKLYNPTEEESSLRPPEEVRKEIKHISEQLKEFKGFKTEHMFLSKRDRLMKTAWRHGVFGYDDADSGKTQVFYQEKRDEKERAQREKDNINRNRYHSKRSASNLIL